MKNGSAETTNTSERARRAWRKPHPWTFWPRDARTNREHPPDFINIKVEELVGDRPFDNLDDHITQGELRALSENYKRIAGFSLADVENA